MDVDISEGDHAPHQETEGGNGEGSEQGSTMTAATESQPTKTSLLDILPPPKSEEEKASHDDGPVSIILDFVKDQAFSYDNC